MTELKINALNQLRLLKQSTFKDPLSFLDEDVQNAQRAKAENITITTDYFEKTLTIFNDGAVLEDPQKLFSIAESGWDYETVKSENPFGIGFFSNIVVSNLITIKTGDKYITFDVNNMLEKNNTQVDVQESSDYTNGFELTLHQFDYSNHSQTAIKERVQSLSDFIHDINITFNDEILEHKQLTEWDDTIKFAQSIENDMCIGWIGAASNWSWSEKLSVYYKGRFVTNLDDVYNITGKLHIHDNILNLVAPDRKDIIQDEKRVAFVSMIKSSMTELCNELIINQKDDLSEFSSCIKRYMNKDTVKDKIKFITFQTKDEHAIDYLSGMASMCEEYKDIKSIEDYEIFLKTDKAKAHQIAEENGIKLNLHVTKLYEEDLDDLDDAATKSERSRTVYSNPPKKQSPLAEIGAKDDDTIIIQGETIKKQKEPIFYLRFSDISELRYKLFIARHYNLRIVFARNDIEYELLENMLKTESGAPIIHISKLIEDVTISGDIKNMNLTEKEKRAEMLFGMISTMFHYKENIFVIGDVNVTKTLEISSIGLMIKIKDNNVKILYSKEYDTIFIDRSILNNRKLTPNLSSKLNLSDVQFILANINEIATALLGFCKVSPNSKIQSVDVKDELLELISRYTPSSDIPTLKDTCDKEKIHKLTRKEKKRNLMKAKHLNNTKESDTVI